MHQFIFNNIISRIIISLFILIINIQGDENVYLGKYLHRFHYSMIIFSGVEFGRECYCSKNPPRYPLANDQYKCNIPCTGNPNQICGGSSLISVYHNEGAVSHPSSNRPLLCLSMIVKDEAHTITSTLDSIKDIIDCYGILDTGSTDGTPNKIKEYFNDIGIPLSNNGMIWEEPFIDYASSRNRALSLTREIYSPTFILMLSADETVLNPLVMREFLLDVEFSKGRSHDAYPVLLRSDIEFDSVRISRTDAGWIYFGRVHEYLSSPDNHFVSLYKDTRRIMKVKFVATDSKRRYANQFKILKVLLEEIEKNNCDTRSLLYAGATLNILNRHREAYDIYYNLSKCSKWNEESYYAKIFMNEQASFLNDEVSWSVRLFYLLEAYNQLPNRADSIHAIGQYYFNNHQYASAYLFAKIAVSIPRPMNLNSVKNVLLRDPSYLYEWECNRLLAVCSEMNEYYEDCIDYSERVIRVRKKDKYIESVQNNCIRRSHFTAEKVASLKLREIEKEHISLNINEDNELNNNNTFLSNYFISSYLFYVPFILFLSVLLYLIIKYIKVLL